MELKDLVLCLGLGYFSVALVAKVMVNMTGRHRIETLFFGMIKRLLHYPLRFTYHSRKLEAEVDSVGNKIYSLSRSAPLQGQ